jgi:hypothetical protein
VSVFQNSKQKDNVSEAGFASVLRKEARNLPELVSPSPHMRTGTDSGSKTLCSLVFRIPDDAQNPEKI